jgi:hypothetical protein
MGAEKTRDVRVTEQRTETEKEVKTPDLTERNGNVRDDTRGMCSNIRLNHGITATIRCAGQTNCVRNLPDGSVFNQFRG